MASAAPPAAFSARIPTAQPIYDIVTRWWTARDAYGSIFSTKPLWARKNVGALHRVLHDGLPRDAGCAPDELYGALRRGPAEATQLAAEMLWVMLLFPADIKPLDKVGRVLEVWSWSGEALSSAHPHLAALGMGGLQDAGPGYSGGLWRELAFMVRLVDAWKAMEGGSSKAEIKIAPLEFASWLDRIEGAGTAQLRHILLHLRFPDTFEPVPSAAHKRHIARVYAPVARVGNPGVGWSDLALLDARLLAVRAALQARTPATRFDFYAPEVAQEWLPAARAADHAGGRAAVELSPAAARVLAHAQALARLRTDAREGAHGLVVLASAFALSRADGRDDLAHAILARLVAGEAEGEWSEVVGAMLAVYGIPPDALAAVPEQPYARGGDEVLDAIVSEARGISGDTSPSAGGKVSVRHLLAVLLRPGSAYSASPHLRARGVDVPALRHEIIEFLLARPRHDHLEAWRRMMLGAVVEEPPSHPGYVSDTADGDDQLAVTGDVEALATVLAAATVQPPVSVGLFGDWGSGKSFFMRRMERRIAEISVRSRRARLAGHGSAYCTGVVQIWFNAWHYLDANLWASMVTRVFDGLAEALAPPGDQEGETRKRLFGELQANQAMLAEAEGRVDQARGELQVMQERAAALGTRRDGVRARLDDAARTAGALLQAVQDDPGVRGSLDDAARALRLPEDRVAAAEVQARIAELQGFGGTLRGGWDVLRRQGSRAAQIGVAGAGVALLAAGAWGAWRFGVADRLPAAIASVGAALGSVVALAAPWMALAARGRRMLEAADARLEAL
ncbi:MAG TPA: P-loop NTPase fold protein, partial [Longimicrobiaceae bacterium]|nr:P-loop NTPase fold protein [Longimicrobiaceae bacterium]